MDKQPKELSEDDNNEKKKAKALELVKLFIGQIKEESAVDNLIVFIMYKVIQDMTSGIITGIKKETLFPDNRFKGIDAVKVAVNVLRNIASTLEDIMKDEPKL